MSGDVGTFRIDLEIENPARAGGRRAVPAALVDTGAKLSWVPAEVLESLGVERNSRWHYRPADGTVAWRHGIARRAFAGGTQPPRRAGLEAAGGRRPGACGGGDSLSC